ncbi:hypothetical protein PYW07_007188 [Mythimna separata]|uniref:RING-type domain-containing protein n=1 Tax=Mythimna separata TaxID=271217 RepID=A0AAD8E0X6_MYTSE|nr:hypothetical protein PYW07_007188 [Mythimna separata]
MAESSDIIDLTSSFRLVEHFGLSNVVIDLLDTDDSFCIEVEDKDNSKPSARASEPTTAALTRKKIKKRKSVAASPIPEKNNKFGSCPICRDELGKNPLASTICGHVYCINCIQTSLKLQKNCPVCRKSLKVRNPYHPLYLST